jgi:hypothetical protein
MIIAQLLGGTGNQMFQYALARRLSIKFDTELKLYKKSLETVNVNTYRNYALSSFMISENFATEKEVDYFRNFKKIDCERKFSTLYGLQASLHNFFVADRNKYVKQKKFEFEPNILEVSPNAFLDGHWISFRYFEPIRDIILKDFRLKKKFDDTVNKPTLKKIKNTISIALHIRRGDYVKHKETKLYHGLTPISYYEKSISYILKEVKNPHFFIFSDDILWCKKNLNIDFPTTFVSDQSSGKDYEDLILMKNCKHFITANSTFSWWGAWLSENDNKIVITPKKWFENSSRNLDDLLPQKWIKI